MEVAGEFIGRFHPALVHLPIGILILAVIFVWLDQHGRVKVPPDVIRLSFGLGAIAAILSSVTGFLLSREGGYDSASVQWHQWMGISTAVVSVMMWRISVSLLKWTSTIMLVMLIVTGHLGATLTHGPAYLTEPFALRNQNEINLLGINYDSARIYADVIAQILEQHCYSCHGGGKQKGKLRLDAPTFILAGGKNGTIIVPGSPQESEMMERLRLPLDDEHHMPPKEKVQPDEAKIELIARWIESGASFDKSLKEAMTSQEWTAIVSDNRRAAPPDIPAKEVAAPDESVLDDLRALGVSVARVSQESNYLQLNFVASGEHLHDALARIEPIAANVVWLKLGNTTLRDSSMSTLGKLKNLTHLGLERTAVTDAGLAYLKNLELLAVLNLGGTRVSLEGLNAINHLRKLRSLNLYQTQIRPDLAGQVQLLFPTAEIEFGEYDVPLLPTDTIVIK